MPLVANMRMYGVNAEVTSYWMEFAQWVSKKSGVDLEIIEHPAPAPIDDLWSRPDMGLVQMCGWPFWRRSPRPHIIAAPVMDHDFAEDIPVYWSEFVTRADAPMDKLEDSFGGKIAWTIENSHSGCNAPRHTLLPHFLSTGGPLYSKSIGPVITPRGSIEAVLSGQADIAPVDSYYHLLMQRYEPTIVAKLKTVARTEKSPIPLLVAANCLDTPTVGKLRNAVTQAHENVFVNSILKKLAIRKFVVPEIESYSLAEMWHVEAIKHGYPLPS